MNRLLQLFNWKIQSISQIFYISVCSTLQFTVVILMLVFLRSICPVLNAAFDLFASRHRQKLEKIKLNQLIVVEDLSGSILHFWVAFWKLAQFFTRPYYVDLGLEPKNSRSPRCAFWRAPGVSPACPWSTPWRPQIFGLRAKIDLVSSDKDLCQFLECYSKVK